MPATQNLTQDGNGTTAAVPVTPDAWHNFRAWDTSGTFSSDFDGGTVHLQELVDPANSVWEEIRDKDGNIQSVGNSGGGFQFCPAGAQIRMVVAGGGGDEDVTARISRVRE